MEISTIGLDLAKNVFQIHAVDATGNVVIRKALRRRQVLPFFAKLPPCLIGMEACGTSHHWARELVTLGHEVRLMPPAYVKPYVKRGKTDAADAEAICEAVTRPTMRFVPVKSAEQQAALALHRTRDLLVRQRTQLVNMIRGLLAEFGIDMVRGLHHALAFCRAACRRRGARSAAPGAAHCRWAGTSDRRSSASPNSAREGASCLASLKRAVATARNDPWHRRHLGHRAGGLGGRTGALPLGSTVCRFFGPDAACQLQRRQGAIGQDLTHG